MKEGKLIGSGEEGAISYIKANRFLRGMVRLIVGSSVNAGLGKITIDELKECLDNQSLLPHAWSVPAEGLFLEGVGYRADFSSIIR